MSRVPRNRAEAVDEPMFARIVRLHEAHPHWGPKKIRELYRRSYGEVPSESTFKRLFTACNWTKPRRRRPRTETGGLRNGLRALACNDVWTVDFKGWWLTGDGNRFEPLTVRDEYSYYLFCAQAMESTTTEAVKEVFVRLFRRYGLPGAIRSDNGSPFASRSAIHGISRLSAWWLALGINLERGRPGKPQDNGSHERMHKDISQELE